MYVDFRNLLLSIQQSALVWCFYPGALRMSYSSNVVILIDGGLMAFKKGASRLPTDLLVCSTNPRRRCAQRFKFRTHLEFRAIRSDYRMTHHEKLTMESSANKRNICVNFLFYC